MIKKIALMMGFFFLTVSMNIANSAVVTLPFLDDFNGSISSYWNIINQDVSLYNVTDDPGHLRIYTTKTDFYINTNNIKNLFALNLPATNQWTATMKVDAFHPTVPFHCVGMVAMTDLDNYIRIDYEQWDGHSTPDIVTFLETNASAVTLNRVNVGLLSPPFWLRISKNSNGYSTYYSLDGTKFTQLSSNSASGKNFNQVGLFALHATTSSAPSIPADIDYFRVDGNSPLTDGGLIAYYPFNGNANDASGNGYNGTVNGASLTTDRFGKPNSAYLLNGTGANISTNFLGVSSNTTNGITGSNPRTISLWAKTSSNNQMYMLSYGYNSTTAGSTFRCGLNYPINGSQCGGISNNPGVVIDTSQGAMLYTANVSNNVWHHYVWVVPNISNPTVSDVLIYMDGNLLTTIKGYCVSNTTAINTKSGNPLVIGKYFDSTIPGYFDGAIGDIRIYNRALSVSEILELYNGINNPSPNVASFYTFDRYSSVTLTSPAGTTFNNIQVVSNPSPTNAPKGVSFPIGFFSYNVGNVLYGGNIDIDFLTNYGIGYGEPIPIDFDCYYMYGSEPENPTPHWYDFTYDGQTGAEINGSDIILHFGDGLRGDDDLIENGIIVDAGGPGIKTETVIKIASFSGIPKSDKVILSWSTESEIDNAGFNIYRSEAENGEYVKINDALIPAQGSSTQGASYEFIDNDAQNRKTYYYKLEDIDLKGQSTMHGPVSATPRLIYDFVK
jgi:hypothetical protein